MSQLLQASGVSFAYGDRAVLHDAEISLSAGQVVTLIGPNGSGKSTLVKLLLGYLRGQGSIAWEGKPLQSWTRRQLARRVAYMPQFPAYDAEQTVSDVLRLGRAPYLGAFGLESPHDLHVVEQVAKLLELEELIGRRMDELSGGQRQRVFIGRCLVQEPRALLLDEPNAFLDLRHQVELSRLLKQLAAERSLGVLMVSHDLNLAAMFADHLVLLGEGRVVAAGLAAEVLRPELLSSVYGVPMQRVDHPGCGAPLVFPDIREEKPATTL